MFTLENGPSHFLGEKTRGVLLGIFRGGMPPGSPNPDPISDEKTLFLEPIFKPGL